jgi:UDP-galactopyranose mutase
MYDFLIVGAGIFGSVFAHEMKRKGKSVLVIDKRDHIGGNCFTKNEAGVDVHVYGPHIFHTSDDDLWAFVNQFAKFNNYINKPKVNYEGKIFSFPINLMTLHQLWGVCTPAEAEAKLKSVRIPCDNPRNLEEWILSQVGREIYETFIYGYTAKQWSREPSELPASIIKRLPIRLTYDENYFVDKYQGIPIGGYTPIFQSLLEGVETELSVDFFRDRMNLESKARTIVYTGKIDEFFNYQFGDLEYRSLSFQSEIVEGDFQGNAVINYTQKEIPWTRITEHKHFQPQALAKTPMSVVTKEFPVEGTRESTPYYPVSGDKNDSIARQYKEFASLTPNTIFGGRLAEYKYYDMHQVMASALKRTREIT